MIALFPTRDLMALIPTKHGGMRYEFKVQNGADPRCGYRTGRSRAYGFQAITDIGAALQEASESADIESSRKWVGDMSSYLDRVETTSQ
jgi:hypothetical protein